MHVAGSLLAVGLLLLAATPVVEAPGTPLMRFGMDRASIQRQIDLGVRPDYAQYWAGVWNEASGWSTLGTWADQIADQDILPVIEWWYWGDDISRSCVSNGCWSDLHDRWKNRANWRNDAIALANTLHNALDGRPAILIIESEFNKGDIATWETFDGYLAEHADIFRDRAPELRLTLGFGNWGREHWSRFDRAVAAMDKVGFQTMRGSTRDTATEYLDAVDAIKDATSALRSRFPGKPVLLHDFALSSYSGGTWAGRQESVIREFFDRVSELRDAGLEGMIYRTMRDNPNMDPANYYGIAERHWGLETSSGSPKVARNDWVEGIRNVRAGSGGSGGSGGGSTFPATFHPRAIGNDWWVETDVTSSHLITRVDARLNGGAWQRLDGTDWGTWADSHHAPGGTRVQFKATNLLGATALSPTYTW